ncbi:MAG TPA: Gfo/Idh/MocA family oxidoreductase [Aggregatilineaceae bacterium]|nr:Gfo/Idh/MocA family oxidoreductase [Aggregatilineaceae bacterium]
MFGANGAAVGVQADGGAMFVAGMSEVEEPPVNDIWTVPGEAHLLDQWQQEDHELFARVSTATYYHQLQIQDFSRAVIEDRAPMVSGEDGRRAVELITAIYRAQESGEAIRFPVIVS